MASRYQDVPRNAHSESVPTFVDEMVFDMERSRGAWLYESNQRRDYIDLTGAFGRLDLGYNHRRFNTQKSPSEDTCGEAEQLQGLRARLVESCGGGPYEVWLGANLEEVYAWTLRTALRSRGTDARIVELRWDESTDLRIACSTDESCQPAALALRDLFDEDDGPVAGLWVELLSVDQSMHAELQRWLGELQHLCESHDALLIFDEVNSGFGRSGRWWDWQHFDVKPDLVVFGGGEKVSGVFSHERLGRLSAPELTLPDASQVAWCDLLLDVIEDEGLVGHAGVMGAYLHKVLTDLRALFQQIDGVSSRGLRASFQLPSESDRDRVLKACLEQSLILLPVGKRTVAFYPPLDVRADAIGRAAAQLEVALQAVYEVQS